MTTATRNLFLLLALIGSLSLIPGGRATAQTFTTLHSFTADSTNSSGLHTNSDGAGPKGLILSGNTLYGTATWGGSSGRGTVFKVNTDGTGFKILHSFTPTPDYPAPLINSDGAHPIAGLILSGNTLYGTASGGGSSGNGTVFAVNTDGMGFTILHSFTATTARTNSDGAYPDAALILSGNTLFGTAEGGGSSGRGTVFAVNTDGTSFTNLHSFTATTNYANSDGAWPLAGLILSGNTLYGTASGGGSSGNGMVFAINTDGTGFTNLYSFTANEYHGVGDGTVFNSDGAGPNGLLLSGNTLYGTASDGGSSGGGTVFKVNTNGTGFTNLHSFNYTNGFWPYAGLILSGNTLFGTAGYGGSSSGAVFAINTDGTVFETLHNFTGTSTNSSGVYTNSDGANPLGGLILSGNTLYGTAAGGGSSGRGTVFSISFAPQLTITPSGANVILTWPTNVAGFSYAGYTLQSTTNLVSPAAWRTVSPWASRRQWAERSHKCCLRHTELLSVKPVIKRINP